MVGGDYLVSTTFGYFVVGVMVGIMVVVVVVVGL